MASQPVLSMPDDYMGASQALNQFPPCLTRLTTWRPILRRYPES